MWAETLFPVGVKRSAYLSFRPLSTSHILYIHLGSCLNNAMDLSPPEPNGQITPAESSSPATSIQRPTRSRKGCFSCRRRKVKCDENPPQCRNCKIGDRQVSLGEMYQGTGNDADQSVIGQQRMRYQRTRKGDRLHYLVINPSSISRIRTMVGEGALRAS